MQLSKSLAGRTPLQEPEGGWDSRAHLPTSCPCVWFYKHLLNLPGTRVPGPWHEQDSAPVLWFHSPHPTPNSEEVVWGHHVSTREAPSRDRARLPVALGPHSPPSKCSSRPTSLAVSPAPQGLEGPSACVSRPTATWLPPSCSNPPRSPLCSECPSSPPPPVSPQPSASPLLCTLPRFLPRRSAL